MSTTTRVLLCLGLVQGAVIVTLVAGRWSDPASHDELIALCTGAIVIELWLAVLALGCALWVRRRPLADVLGWRTARLRPGQIAWLALGTLAASHALDGALDRSGLGDESVLGEIPRILHGAEGARLLLALLALGVAPGIAEELLCRGLVQRGLVRRLGPGFAIPAAALLFGLLHLEPIHAALASVLGLYLGWIAHLADSTRTPMLCHALNNLAAVLLAAGVGEPPWGAAESLLGGSLLAAFCLWKVGAGRRPDPPPAHSGHEALPPGPTLGPG